MQATVSRHGGAATFLLRQFRGGTGRCGSTFQQHQESTAASTDQGRLIYHSPMIKYVLGGKIFSLSSSAVGLAFQPLLLAKLGDLGAAKFLVAGGFGVFIFATPLLLHWLTRSFVSRIYYNASRGEYTALSRGLFLNTRRHVFRAEETGTTLGFPFATVEARGRSLFILPEHFEDIEDYARMMRYNKSDK